MDVAVIAFTRNGFELGQRLEGFLLSQGNEVRLDRGFGEEKIDHHQWTREGFEKRDALIYIGATGIAVRSIAPCLKSKGSDPAIIVMDEAASFCIPLASGHLGGANDLARQLSQFTGAVPVITTASDVNGVFAVDDWARRQGLLVEDTAAIKDVTATLLAGGEVSLSSEFAIAGPVPKGLRVVGEGAPGAKVHVGVHTHGEGLVLVAPCAVLGIGCRKGTPAQRILQAAQDFLDANALSPRALKGLASIDLKANEEGILALAREWGLPFVTYSAEELNAVEGQFSASAFVSETTGTDSVCERSAVAAGGSLLVGKTVIDGITLALGVQEPSLSWGGTHKPGTVVVVGLGPGDKAHMTQQAVQALTGADIICGYTKYVELAKAVAPSTPVLSTGMTKEIDRCRAALDQAAQGMNVAMVCSGDAGVYGMSGLIMELAPEFPGVEIEVVPGTTAALSGGAVLGAPLTHDFCVISLSDLLTPWELIEKRLAAAAAADFCIALYNPSSHRRSDYLQKACDLLLANGKDAGTVCGVVRNIGRQGQESWTGTLQELRGYEADMFCTVFVGNARTKVIDGRMVTPRGYDAKPEWTRN